MSISRWRLSRGVPHTNHDASHGTSITSGAGFLSQELTAQMSFPLVAAMTGAELLGNSHLKWFAENGSAHHLGIGLFAWAVTIFFLIKSLGQKSLMWTCIMWEAMIVIGGALVAYFIFGEKFNHWIQWLGILLALGAAICVNYDCGSK